MAARSSSHSAGLSATPAASRLCAIRASMFLLLASAFSAACRAWPVNAFDAASSARGPDCPGTAITPYAWICWESVTFAVAALPRPIAITMIMPSSPTPMAPTAPYITLAERSSGPALTCWGRAWLAFSAAMSLALRTGTYAEAVKVSSVVGTVTSTFELVSSKPAGTSAVTTIWRARSSASLAKAAVRAAGSAVVSIVPLPALAIAFSGAFASSPRWSETTLTCALDALICSTTSSRGVAVVSLPSESTRILRWPAFAPPGPAASSAPRTPS